MFSYRNSLEIPIIVGEGGFGGLRQQTNMIRFMLSKCCGVGFGEKAQMREKGSGKLLQAGCEDLNSGSAA